MVIIAAVIAVESGTNNFFPLLTSLRTKKQILFMLKTTNLPIWWIGYYFGQNCVIHPDTGRWILTGYFSELIECKRNIGTPDEDVEIYPIEDVQFILKKINPFLFASMSKFSFFIKTKAMEGYWMNFDEKFNNKIVFEPCQSQSYVNEQKDAISPE